MKLRKKKFSGDKKQKMKSSERKNKSAYKLISYLCPISLYQKKDSYRIISNHNKNNRLNLDMVGISALLSILQENFEVSARNEM